MRLYPEKLSAQLQKELLPAYLVSGDEPLLLQESCDMIRAAARRSGCNDRQVIDASVSGFDWSQILHSATAMSLFAERRLVELRLPSGKPGAEGSKALCEYVDIAGPDNVLLIVAGKIDKQSTKAKWFKALDGYGAIIQVWPVDARGLPRWLEQRIGNAGMSIAPDALQMLTERVEGNLLAAVQEIEKLKLLADDGKISAETVTSAVADNARYNVFEMTDHALQANARNSLRMLHGLRAEGTDATVALWALLREIRTLYEVRCEVDGGASAQQALSARRVWNNRMPLMQSALGRHNQTSLSALMARAAEVDGSIKGFANGRPWDGLERLICELSGISAAQIR